MGLSLKINDVFEGGRRDGAGGEGGGAKVMVLRMEKNSRLVVNG
jgi:hypothetical protein